MKNPAQVYFWKRKLASSCGAIFGDTRRVVYCYRAILSERTPSCDTCAAVWGRPLIKKRDVRGTRTWYTERDLLALLVLTISREGIIQQQEHRHITSGLYQTAYPLDLSGAFVDP